MNSIISNENLSIVIHKIPEIEKCILRVVITDATNYTARSLAYRILTDEVFGPKQGIILSFFETGEHAMFLQAIAIEITSCAPNFLKDVIYSSDPSIAFADADIIFSVGKARDYNFSVTTLRGDPFFADSSTEAKVHAKAIENYAKKDAKIITLGNISARVLSEYAPSIPKENITVVSLVLQNLASSAIAKRANRVPDDVTNLIIWGTNSKLCIPDCNYAKFKDGKSVTEELMDNEWCKKTLPKVLVGLFRRCRYRMSESLALAQHCKYLMQGTPPGEWTSMSVVSDGSYDVQPGLYFSFPVSCKDGKWEIVQGLHVDDYCKRIIRNIKTVLDKKIEAALEISRRADKKEMVMKTERKSILKPDYIRREIAEIEEAENEYTIDEKENNISESVLLFSLNNEDA